ncbi:MAG: hypothetical protein J6S24_01730 [Lentisphaeria bacterium]|nr:hypothetical protein [Lentisphaeria bacterium]
MEKSVITLAGVKHCGKSTLGRLAAERCGFAFFDAYAELERLHDKGTRELFRELGEEQFRRMESEVLSLISGYPGHKVISLGGGAVTNSFVTPETWNALQPLVMIDIPEETACERVFANGVPAYLEKYSDPVAALRDINSERRAQMKKKCDAIYNAAPELSPEDQAERFIEFLEKEGIL